MTPKAAFLEHASVPYTRSRTCMHMYMYMSTSVRRTPYGYTRNPATFVHDVRRDHLLYCTTGPVCIWRTYTHLRTVLYGTHFVAHCVRRVPLCTVQGLQKPFGQYITVRCLSFFIFLLSSTAKRGNYFEIAQDVGIHHRSSFLPLPFNLFRSKRNKMAKISSPKAATGSKAKTPSTSSKMKAGASKNAVKALVPAKAAKDATVVKTPTSVQFTVNTTRTVTVSGGNVDSK